MEKFFCHKKVKILVLKKEQGKNLYRYNKWETEQNVCKKWPEQCSIKHVNCEATIEFLWLWIGLTLRFSRVDMNNGKIIHYIWEDAWYIFICLFFLNYYIYMLIFDIWKWLGEVKKLVVSIADFYSTMHIKGTSY